MLEKSPRNLVWIPAAALALGGDWLWSGIVPFQALLWLPVVLAARLSGRFWGLGVSFLLPLAHAAILIQTHAKALTAVHLILLTLAHILTSVFIVELIHRLLSQEAILRSRSEANHANLPMQAKPTMRISPSLRLDPAHRHDRLPADKVLTGMLPICAGCKSIRDDKGYWKRIEEYLEKHSELEFSHGVCPECIEKLYPEYAKAQF